MEDITSQFTPEEMEEKKLMAILCYLGLLVLIPILQEKDSAYIKFHINQGIVLSATSFVLSLFGMIPVIGMIIGLAGTILFFAGAVINILNITNGKAVKVPFLSNFEIIK